ncbi:uncharacterized protein BDW47DRAFT_60757 [Aspergillus candidus]|uniref:Uncharacterized protein n=1 Tax=Aspergillus candidus TaxID=41067 RepID=A0A2I2F4V3_ASPCN|nr:hypothetical protein BDW47DRAFT_60757 [Aspergillus candidus]PLB35596.1 hypothetical protein BDW47DRAFT_60757 [Aspergillus candidus]
MTLHSVRAHPKILAWLVQPRVHSLNGPVVSGTPRRMGSWRVLSQALQRLERAYWRNRCPEDGAQSVHDGRFEAGQSAVEGVLPLSRMHQCVKSSPRILQIHSVITTVYCCTHSMTALVDEYIVMWDQGSPGDAQTWRGQKTRHETSRKGVRHDCFELLQYLTE